MGNIVDVLERFGPLAPQGPSLGKTPWGNSATSLRLLNPTGLVELIPARSAKPSKWKGGKRPRCPDSYIFQEVCGHGCWRWRRVPCDKWSCPSCSKWRVIHELGPELSRAITWAMELGVTAKFLTLTWQGKSPAAQPTQEGSKLRSRHVEYLIRWIRTRQRGFCHYLRVSETHKSGKVHVHMVLVSPRIPWQTLRKQWEAITGDSFEAEIENLYITCPTPGCWVRHQRSRYKSKVSPPGGPNTGRCQHCKYSPDWSNPQVVADVARAAAQYVGKYLTKQPEVDGLKRKMNRSQEWNRVCRPGEEIDQVSCLECENEHRFEFTGSEEKMWSEKYVGIGGVTCTALVAYHPSGSTPCYCWDAKLWRRGRADAELALWDLFRVDGKQDWRGG